MGYQSYPTAFPARARDKDRVSYNSLHNGWIAPVHDHKLLFPSIRSIQTLDFDIFWQYPSPMNFKTRSGSCIARVEPWSYGPLWSVFKGYVFVCFCPITLASHLEPKKSSFQWSSVGHPPPGPPGFTVLSLPTHPSLPCKSHRNAVVGPPRSFRGENETKSQHKSNNMYLFRYLYGESRPKYTFMWFYVFACMCIATNLPPNYEDSWILWPFPKKGRCPFWVEIRRTDTSDFNSCVAVLVNFLSIKTPCRRTVPNTLRSLGSPFMHLVGFRRKTCQKMQCQCHGQNMSKHVVYASVSIMASWIHNGWPILQPSCDAVDPRGVFNMLNPQLQIRYPPYMVVSINEGTPIAAWFLVENPMTYSMI
jgi:hypothetical protein